MCIFNLPKACLCTYMNSLSLHMVFPFPGMLSPQISLRFSFSLSSGHCSNVTSSEKPCITPLYKIVTHLSELLFVSCFIFSITFKEIRFTEVINETDYLRGAWCVQFEFIQISKHKSI